MAPATTQGFSRTSTRSRKPCYFHLQGMCTKGQSCGFSHDGVDQNASADPTTKSLIVCKHFKRGRCIKGEDCPYDHPISAHLGEPLADSDHDSFYREFFGVLVHFVDGGSVSNVLMASDFSAVQLKGLPSTSTSSSVSQMLQAFGHTILPSAVHIFAGQTGRIAHITSTDPSFAETLGRDLVLSEDPRYADVYAVTTAPRLPSWASSRRISCRKLLVSWEQPTRAVRLRYLRGDSSASVASADFREGILKICGQKVAAFPPQEDDDWSIVVLKYAPQNICEEDVRDAIRQVCDVPLLIDLGEIRDGVNVMTSTTDMVESLLSKVGPLEFTLITGPHRRQAKAVATFLNEGDAQEAVKQLHNQPQECIKGKTLSFRLLRSCTIRVPRCVYEAVEDQLAAHVPEWTERRLTYKVAADPTPQRRFVTLKVECGHERDVAVAASVIDGIVSGRVVQEGEQNFWCSRLATDTSATHKLKQIGLQQGVLLLRHKSKRQVRYYGPPELFRQVSALILAQIGSRDVAQHILYLTPTQFEWLCRGGLRQIQATLLNGHVSLDVMAQPKKLTINGSDEVYQQAKTVMESQCPGKPFDPAAISSCVICLCDPEDPMTIECGHNYCRECFEGLCTSTGTASKDFSIRCAGDAGACQRAVSLNEIKAALSSSIFEDVLENSFTKFVQRRPDSFRNCPTPDCGSIYRIVTIQRTINPFTCPKCFAIICAQCFQLHDDTVTCDEHKDLAAGGYGAFERYKKQMNIKDCPRCSTPIEKIDGCNHMHCSGCRCHLCWVCLETFDESQPCYDHMNREHGGNGLQDEFSDDDDDDEMDD